ncbi:MAG: hypothetical protein Q9207_006388 [Kuettlingeria erythrocarpa]
MESDEMKALRAEVRKLKSDKEKSKQAEYEKAKIQQEKIEQQERLLQDTTLDEFLKASHEQLFNSLEVQGNPKYSTLGTLTSPQGKACPQSLEPWTDFPRIRDEVFGEIRDALHPSGSPLREFISLKGIQDQGRQLGYLPLISSEEDLKQFHYRVVEPYVAMIINPA